MALPEYIIFSDPVMQRVFFDGRAFAPRRIAGEVEAAVTCLEMSIAEDKVIFLKAKQLPAAEKIQIRMRRRWFAIRKLCDGYFLKMPAGYSDGCEHIEAFRYASNARVFNVDARQRYALWRRYEKRPPPDAWQLRPSK